MKAEAHVWVVEVSVDGGVLWEPWDMRFTKAEAARSKVHSRRAGYKFRIRKYIAAPTIPPPCGSEGKP